MRSFNLLARLLGHSAAPAPFVAGEALTALQGSLDGGKSCVLPKGSVLVPASKHPEAERIAESIREYPDDWVWARKGYDIQHVPSGFRIWVANDDYGLAEVHDNNGNTDFSKPEQAIIWPAVKDWLGHRKVGFTGRPVRPRLVFRNGHFWCQSKEHPWRGLGESAEQAYDAWLSAVSAQARGRKSKGQVLTVWSANQ